MSSTPSVTSAEDTGGNAVEETAEDATRPFPASDDTRPLAQPLTQPVTQPLPQSPTTPRPMSNGAATDVPSAGAPGDTDQASRPRDADAESGAVAQTDVLASSASSSASNQDGFSTSFDADPFGRGGKNGEDSSTSAAPTPASSASSPVWSAGTVTGKDQQPPTPRDIKGSTLLWGAFLLLVGGLLIAAGLGLRFDFTTTAIACLAGLGILLVIVALIPKRRSGIKP